MLNIKKLSTLNELHALKAQYFSSSTAPLDGMWHFGFVPMSPHFGIYEDNTLAGFFVVNDDGYLLQFYLSPSATSEASLAFTSALHSDLADINGAFVSTAEPNFFVVMFRQYIHIRDQLDDVPTSGSNPASS